MSQFLLKAKYEKFSTQTTTVSEPSERQQKITKIMFNRQCDNLRTPQHDQNQFNQTQQEQQTPFFYHKFKETLNKISTIEGSSSKINQNSENQRNSQVEQIIYMAEEQLHPMILSNINDPQPGINKLLYLRLRNSLSQIKQAQFELVNYLQNQKKFIKDFHQKLCLDIEAFISKQRKKNDKQVEINQLRSQNSILRQKIDRRETEYQRMSRELKSTRNSLDQKQKQLKSSRTKKLEQEQCIRCIQISSRFHSIRTQKQKKQQQVQRMKAENQKLQEYIFDIQQKIVGIELEVQRKLKEKILFLAEYKDTQIQKEVKQLKRELQEINKKYRQLEQNAHKYGQLDLINLNLQEKQRTLRTYQLSLIEQQKEYDELKIKNYERQNQILQAEQNLLQKINEIRKKEKELSDWQTQLTQKAKEVINKTLQGAPIQQTDQIIMSRQMSLKSFGRSPHDTHYQFQQEITQRIKTQQNQFEHSTIHKPQILSKQTSLYNGKRVIIANKYLPNDYKDTGSYKKQLDTSHQFEKLVPSPQNLNISLRSKVTQNGAFAYNNLKHRDLSKNSKQSISKSMKNIYQNSGYAYRVDDAPLSGLGNKLQRLREQIKKQIQSIK